MGIYECIESLLKVILPGYMNRTLQKEKYEYEKDKIQFEYEQRELERLKSIKAEIVKLAEEIKGTYSRTRCVSQSNACESFKEIYNEQGTINEKIAQLSGLVYQISGNYIFDKLKIDVDNLHNYQRDFYTALDRKEKLNFYSEEWRKIFEFAGKIEIDCDELIEVMRNELTAEYM